MLDWLSVPLPIYYVFKFDTVYFRYFRRNLVTTDINEANILLYKV